MLSANQAREAAGYTLCGALVCTFTNRHSVIFMRNKFHPKNIFAALPLLKQ